MLEKSELLKKLADAGITEADLQTLLPPVQTDADLQSKNERLQLEIDKLKNQQKIAVDIANKAITDQKIRDEAERQTLIAELVVDSDGQWTQTELDKLSTRELNLVKITLTKRTDATFASIAAYNDEQKRMNAPKLTAFGVDLNAVSAGGAK
ncbi:MAG: hypothetical protein FWD52_00365 [Candidatus Bathyarchaeota archaeon]|nr:hypothetical protein [Candidatus Termiticorpusculum sp.]